MDVFLQQVESFSTLREEHDLTSLEQMASRKEKKINCNSPFEMKSEVVNDVFIFESNILNPLSQQSSNKSDDLAYFQRPPSRRINTSNKKETLDFPPNYLLGNNSDTAATNRIDEAIFLQRPPSRKTNILADNFMGTDLLKISSKGVVKFFCGLQSSVNNISTKTTSVPNSREDSVRVVDLSQINNFYQLGSTSESKKHHFKRSDVPKSQNVDQNSITGNRKPQIEKIRDYNDRGRLIAMETQDKALLNLSNIKNVSKSMSNLDDFFPAIKKNESTGLPLNNNNSDPAYIKLNLKIRDTIPSDPFSNNFPETENRNKLKFCKTKSSYFLDLTTSDHSSLTSESNCTTTETATKETTSTLSDDNHENEYLFEDTKLCCYSSDSWDSSSNNLTSDYLNLEDLDVDDQSFEVALESSLGEDFLSLFSH